MRARMSRHLTSLRESPETARAAGGGVFEARREEAPAPLAPPEDAAAQFTSRRSAAAFRALRGGTVAAPTIFEAATAVSTPFDLPPEFTWHDYAIFLLHTG